MDELLNSFIEFIIMFIIIFFVYKLFYKKKKDFNKLKPRDEIRGFILKYDIDVRRIDYNKLLNVLALINSFIISFVCVIIVRINSMIWKIVICFLIVMVLIYSLFEIAGRYFKSHEKNVDMSASIEEVIKDTNKKKKKTKKTKKKEDEK